MQDYNLVPAQDELVSTMHVTPHAQSTFSTPRTENSPQLTSVDPMLPCMWAACHARFGSMSELVGHVNLEHLRLPSFSAPPDPKREETCRSDISSLACQWRDCDVYRSAESIPSASSGDPIGDMLNTLAHHLLYDHLGLNHSGDDAPSAMQQSSQHSMPPRPFHTELSRTTKSPSPEKHDELRACLWQSCDASFQTFDDLTRHITVEHIGGGKAHYECFWENCNRNGPHGFSSKQKICRHVQVICSSPSLIVLTIHRPVSYGTSSPPMRNLSPEFLRSRDVTTTHASSHARKQATVYLPAHLPPTEFRLPRAIWM